MGYLPQAMVNFLARIGWSFGDQEIFSLEELIEKFSLENVGKSAGVFNEEKLIWLNSHYIKNESDEALADLLTPFLEKRGFFSTNRDGLFKITACLKERSKTLQEMAEASEYFFRPPRKFAPDAAKKFLTHEIGRILSDMINQINAMTSFRKSEIEVLFKKIQDVNNIKLVKLAQAVRVALTGKAVSPGIYEVMEILDREEVVARLKKAIDYIESNT
jgi:glutamyl-tRNA synthetase